MTSKFPHLRSAIVRHPWAIMPDRLEAIAEVIERRVEGVRLSPEEIAGIKGSRIQNGLAGYWSRSGGHGQTPAVDGQGNAANPVGVIAVINIMGILAQHAGEVDDISGPGGTSTERLATSFRAALNDPSVKAIVFNIDSPGGNVYGIQQLTDEIFKARGQKPIVAQVNSLTASAAYWIAASADEIVMTPGSQAGSIGVYALHEDDSKLAEMAGVKFTFIYAGKYKVEGNSLEPLGTEAAQAIQRDVDAYYRDFTAAVARGRGVSVADVVDGFAEGRVAKDKDAVKLGMADRVGTLDDTLRRLSSRRANAPANAAIIERPASAKALEVERRIADGLQQFNVVGEFPACLMISGELLEELHDRHGTVVENDASEVAFSFDNGRATYRFRGFTADNDWVGDMIPDAVAAQREADMAAFRRRRHAHRMRSI